MSGFAADLRDYYEHVFPVSSIVSWLSYGSADTLSRREFCFTMIGDIFSRFRTYPTAADLKRDLVKYTPEKIDAGAVYHVRAELKAQTKLIPLERELVFDIDMSDYDKVRSCCKGKSICVQCWPWMACAAKILRRYMEVDFGFKHFLPVFSGRRGLHFWVCDSRARALTNEERDAIVHYMLVIDSDNKVNVTRDLFARLGVIHPTLKWVDDEILKDTFRRVFLDPDSGNYIGLPAPAQVVLGALESVVQDARLPRGCVPDIGQGGGLSEAAIKAAFSSAKVLPGAFENAMTAVRFALLFPRLDVHVSTRRDHLLKLPFCIHPGTMKLCVPLIMASIDSFDPTKDPPKLTELLETRSIEPKWKLPLNLLINSLRLEQEGTEVKEEVEDADVKQELVDVTS